MYKNFNACYLVLLSWLSRMYEIPNWEADKTRRLAIEMVASWPLMSMVIRPFLELVSFFPIDLHKLFRLEPDTLPSGKPKNLLKKYENPERSEKINKEMDF